MNKTSLIFLLFLFWMERSYSQNHHGIIFDSTMTWAQIKSKAKAEKKFIFVDLYATWCVPCKMMEDRVFSNEVVGKEFNENFISIRIQMNRSPGDNERVKSWYNKAEELAKQFSIVAYPTFLFFSSDGEFVHKGVGYKDSSSIIKLEKDAISSKTQFYALNQKYKAGKIKSAKELIRFIDISNENGDAIIAKKVAIKYKRKYFDKLSSNQLNSVENISFADDFRDLFSSKDLIFKLCLKSPIKFDAFKPNFSHNFVSYIIEKEEITERIKLTNKQGDNHPNWDGIYNSVARKYGFEFSDDLVLPARRQFAMEKNDWVEVANTQRLEIQNKRIVPDAKFMNESWYLNITAWRAYQHCTDTIILKEALSWIDLSLKIASCIIPNPSEQYYDTKARLLYKLGRTSEAIENEQMAIDMGNKMAQLRGDKQGSYSGDYSTVLSRMKNNEPIDGLGP